MIHYEEYVYIRYTFFRQITTFINIRIDFTKLFQLKGLKPKNKGHTNFYLCCDLMEKVYLVYIKPYIKLDRIYILAV